MSSGELRFVGLEVEDEIATLTLDRGKVNALTIELFEDVHAALDSLGEDVRALIVTGRGAFYSFGFDVPHILDWPRERFEPFVAEFCRLYRRLFLYERPVVAAINGHAVAGGCMLALTADVRVMATGKAKFSLNEITFGASVFGGVVEMMRLQFEGRVAARMLGTGEMLNAEEALALGVVDRAVPVEDVMRVSQEAARELSRNVHAFVGIKRLLRDEVGERMAAVEPESIEAFLDVWYSGPTQEQLRSVIIR